MARHQARRFDPANLPAARLGIYARASDDDEDTRTSVTAQRGRGEQWAREHGITDVTVYCDNDLSASLYATKDRDDFDRMVADVEAGELDLLWFWTLSRQQRRMDVYVRLRDLCRAKGVAWVVKRRLYDLNDASDLRALGSDAVNAEAFSIELSENVRIGLDLIASQGKPHGPVTYGYRRTYDDRGRYVGQHPDDVPRETATGGTYTRAGVVREIITTLAAGGSILSLINGFAERGIPTATGNPRWRHSTIRDMAMNPAYIGQRVHRGEVLEMAGPCWEPVMATPAEVEAFHAAGNVLRDPARTTTRPARAVHLLSYIARCDRCRQAVQGKPNEQPDRLYMCPSRCCGIKADDLDDFVRRTIDRYVARPDVREHIAAARADDPAVTAARAEAARLRGQLESWRAMAESGEADDPVTVNRTIKGLKRRIAEADETAARLAIPAALRNLEVDWDDLARARQFVAAFAEITVKPVGRGRRNVPLDEHRIGWRWLLGPDAE